MSVVIQNLKTVGSIVGGLNFAGYLITAATETHKITDLIGVGSFVVASGNLLMKKNVFSNPRLLLINVGVMLWGARLSSYLFSRVLRVGEDKRLRKFFKAKDEGFLDKTKSNFPVKLAYFWSIQSLWGFLVLLPVTYVNSVPSVALGPISTGLAALGFLGFLIEAISDWQKDSYRSDPKNNAHWCDAGLWKFSRHPNYFGELLFWWSVYALSLPPLLSSPHLMALGSISPLFITFLLFKVSGIPLLEKAADVKYKDNTAYEQYKKNTPVLVPFSPF